MVTDMQAKTFWFAWRFINQQSCTNHMRITERVRARVSASESEDKGDGEGASEIEGEGDGEGVSDSEGEGDGEGGSESEGGGDGEGTSEREGGLG